MRKTIARTARSAKRVLVLAPTFPPAYLGGGPVRTLDALVREAPGEFEIGVFTSNRDLGQDENLNVPSGVWGRRGNAYVMYAAVHKFRVLLSTLSSVKRDRWDVVYINSFFDPRFSILPQLVWSLLRSRPVILMAPRGEFSKGAIALKAPKKRTFIHVYRLLGFHRRVIWHASSELEAADIRREVDIGARIVVRENETSLPQEPTWPADECSGEGLVKAAFLSRIVPKKGLLLLLESLAMVEATVNLDVYGSEEDHRYVDRCREEAEGLLDHITVRFMGSVPADLVRSTLAPYDVLLFPTAGENFGHVIAESLSVSCPVMTTIDTPWTTRLVAGGGVVVDENSASNWAREIEAYAQQSSEAKLMARQAAASAYKGWRSSEKGPHVFSLLAQYSRED